MSIESHLTLRFADEAERDRSLPGPLEGQVAVLGLNTRDARVTVYLGGQWCKYTAPRCCDHECPRSAA